MMRIVVVGSGTSMPHGSRNSAGFWVETEQARILLDCGAGTLHALPRYGLPWSGVTHVFLSHFHLDHIGELPPLLFALKHAPGTKGRQAPLRIMGPMGTVRLLKMWEAGLGYEILTLPYPVEIEEVYPEREYSLVAGHALRVHRTPHTQESLAVRIDVRGTSVGYTGDTAYSEELSGFFHRADVLIAECSFAQRREDLNHLSIPEVAEMARRAEVPRLVVTHRYPELDHIDVKAEIAALFDGEVILAQDGLRLEI
jgi:ribonuclease BN (tRNA processing enzyme)